MMKLCNKWESQLLVVQPESMNIFQRPSIESQKAVPGEEEGHQQTLLMDGNGVCRASPDFTRLY